MKVLISAYACEPRAGSEPGAGWSWARAAALAGHDVWLVTRRNNRDALDAALVEEPSLSIRPIYFDVDGALRFKRGRRGARLYYLAWQLAARRRLAELHERVRFDVAHHLTFAVDWLPAAAVGIPGLPSVWGPVGGSGSVPVALWRWLGIRGVITEVLREVLIRLARRVFGERNATRAAVTVAQNDDVAGRFAHDARRVVVEPNVALDAVRERRGVSEAARSHPGRQAVFVGRLIGLKGARLAVAALAQLAGDWTLDFYGEGVETATLKRMAARRGLEGRVVFHGQRPRAEVFDALTQADVLVFPSFHDSAGWVVGEAACLGTPVVALDLAGPGTMLRAMGRPTVRLRRSLVSELARSIEEAHRAPVTRSDRWDSARLPAFVDGLYREAVRSASRTGRTAIGRSP